MFFAAQTISLSESNVRQFRWEKHTGRYNDNNEEDDNADDDAHSHLHVLPPHLFSDFVRPSSKILCRTGEIVGLVLQGIEVFTTLAYSMDVFICRCRCVIYFLVKMDVSFMPQDVCLAMRDGAANKAQLH